MAAENVFDPLFFLRQHGPDLIASRPFGKRPYDAVDFRFADPERPWAQVTQMLQPRRVSAAILSHQHQPENIRRHTLIEDISCSSRFLRLLQAVGKDNPVALRKRYPINRKREGADVRDMVGATIAALDSDAALGGIFNVAAPEPMPMPALVEYIAAKTGQEVVSVATPTRRRVCLDVQKMADTFYQPQYGYERMIDDALAFRNGEDTGVIPT